MRLILFIHGLGGAAEGTWRAFRSLTDHDRELTDAFKLRFYEYQTSLVRWRPFSPKPPSIHTLARELRTEIEARYGDASDITLVCHSLGGLIARQYLLEQVKSGRSTAVRRVMLYATPNNGSDLAKVAKAVSLKHQQLKQLCKDSAFLTALNDDWADLDMSDRFEIAYVVAGSDDVVDEVSARHVWGSGHFRTVKGTTHRSLVKPTKESDLAYVIFKEFVLGEPPDLPGAPIHADFTGTWPTPEVLLTGARRSLLFLGTSLSRMINGDMFRYREWLNGEPDRCLGLLMLNPHSPHALGRKREGVQRSSATEIIRAAGKALGEESNNDRFSVAFYEGPFRYSARASDICQESGGTVGVVSSSHSRGTSGGFRISLSQEHHSKAYAFYEEDLLHCWQEALANRPGHGLSVAVRASESISGDLLSKVASDFCAESHAPGARLELFNPAQHHLSIASLCRTAGPLTGPWALHEERGATTLPWHFGEYLESVVGILRTSLPAIPRFEFDQIVLDPTGRVRLQDHGKGDGKFVETVEDVWRAMDGLLTEFTARYADEGWDVPRENGVDRFAQRYPEFLPHVTIGVMFQHDRGLPRMLEGRSVELRLKERVVFEADTLSLVHYAYRSFLRVIGEAPLLGPGARSWNECDLVQELGLRRA